MNRFKEFILVHTISALFAALATINQPKLFRLAYTALAHLAARLARKDYYVEKIFWIKRLFDAGHPSLTVTRNILRRINPHHRRAIVRAAVINQLLVGTNRRKAFSDAHNGNYPPGFFVISPSMKCNLKCFGCYAGSYQKTAELTVEEIDSALVQAKAMGMYFCVVSGGEPFFYPHMFDIFKKHNDVIFHVYTHGGLIDRELCRRLVEVGNVIPAISIEGFREETDARRGNGHFDRIMRAMDLLREAKVLFGFSATLTRRSADLLHSDRFVDFMIEKGCILGWYFMYVPVGIEPDMDLMMTPEQRGRQFERLVQLRATRPILLADFWNDGALVGGCISGGRKYFHINAKGDIEPCVFCHFATHNIRRHTLADAIQSPLFRSIRCQLPCHDNLLCVCTIMDWPALSRKAIAEHNAYYTHPGAEAIYERLSDQMDTYADAYGAIADQLWEKYYPDRARAKPPK